MYSEITNYLLSQQDLTYRTFQSRLMPTVDPSHVIGVRTPVLRKLAKELAGTQNAAEFLAQLPHAYHEENNLHAFLIEQCRNFSACISEVERFLPYIDNWATCDSMSPKVFGKYSAQFLPHILRWLKSQHIYTVRYAVGSLMRWYLDENFSSEYPQLVADIRSEEYYVNMMVAWYFATALAKQPDAILPYFEQGLLPTWTHNKAIQKAIESFRIPAEQKMYLKTLIKR